MARIAHYESLRDQLLSKLSQVSRQILAEGFYGEYFLRVTINDGVPQHIESTVAEKARFEKPGGESKR